MTDLIHKIFCFFGIHEHEEVMDNELTELWFDFVQENSIFKATPCTYLQCRFCGHTYNSRTTRISFKEN